MTEILFVRHGRTEANAAGRWQGWSDPSLDPIGEVQAEAVARRLALEKPQVKAVYTSPLRRALQTAHAIGARLNLVAQILDQLKEIHFGELEGTTLTEMEAQFPELHASWQDKTDMTFEWPRGERRADFFRRAAEACDLILTRHGRDKVVIVTHGGTIRACLAYLLPDQLGAWWSYGLGNAGLSRVCTTGNNARLLALNDTDHLPPECT